jgi:hypothetical protein
VQVTLCYVVLIRLYPLKVSREEYPFSLWTILRLDNESFRLSIIELLFELFQIVWQ